MGSSQNILVFAIEDHFGLDALVTMLGTEYARSYALLLGFLIFSIIAQIIWNKYGKELSKSFSDSLFSLAKIFLVIASTISLYYIIKVLYIYFSGQSSFEGIIRGLISLSVIIFGAGLFYLDTFIRNKSNSRLWFLFLPFIGISMAITGAVLIMKFAPPHELKLISNDKEKIRKLKKVAIESSNYYSKHGKLPADIGNVSKKTNTLKLCVSVEGNWKYAKRISNYSYETAYDNLKDGSKRYCVIEKLYYYKPKKKIVRKEIIRNEIKITNINKP